MTTARLGMPEISSGQASKEVTHNEALRLLDAFVSSRVISRTITAEPGSPTDGDLYIIPASATGTDWSTYTVGDLAHRYAGAWYNYTPFLDQVLYSIADVSLIGWTGSAWLLVGQTGGKAFRTITANTTLTNAEVGPNVLQFGGALGAPVTITIPSGVEKHWAVMNGSGDTLQFEVSGQGFTIDITDGSRGMLVSDGTSVFNAVV